jgi:hydroxymethylpyrimidine pyrophosphatase-like HAD family hydrolase
VVAILRRARIPTGDIVALLPRHPSRRQWQGGYESLPVSDVRVLTLEPEEWRKGKLLEPEAVEHRLQAYFQPGGYARAAVVPSAAAERFNRHLERISEQKFHSRLKRVYEVQLRHLDGHAETRYILAKSVGWGWLGYHAFLAGQALSGFVAPLLGLRDGILYSEWLPAGDPPLPQDRDRLLSGAASYVAARVRSLRLETDPGPELEPQNGRELLAGALIRAFGSPAAALKRARIRRELSREACPVPTLIDGKMRLQEWVRGPISFLKSDYEHHGMGKTELNITDPAYDLAEVILYLHLSPAEEKDLLQRYRQACDDQGVEERLFLHKLLAGMAALASALSNLKEPRLQHRHEEFNRSYIQAWDFLIAQTVRFCGRGCRRTEAPSWRSPLVVMDIDGVLDKQIFGYPSTTAAGIEAVSLLHAHGCAVALNTARPLSEVQEYARAYGCVGGVAEYGSVVWDAVADRTRVLVTPESQAELQRMAEALRSIPGVFLNDGYDHSLRAYTYATGRTNPLPTALVEGLLTQLGLERLTVHQTYLDTAILAREIDKGQGLLALLRLAEREGIETIAIGDSEPDLAMFRVAGRSYAPGHMSGRSVARMLGCEIARRSYQPGLLSAVRSIVHPEGGRCARCRACRRPEGDGLFWELLKTADRRPIESLLRALVDPMSLRAFVR